MASYFLARSLICSPFPSLILLCVCAQVCDDGDACSKDDSCSNDGLCVGQFFFCDLECFNCDGQGGCDIHADKCYIDEICRVKGDPRVENHCQHCGPSLVDGEWVDWDLWTNAPPKPCDDGNLVTMDDFCIEGRCEGTYYECDDPTMPCQYEGNQLGDGTCEYPFKPALDPPYMCRTSQGECEVDAYCNGLQYDCPPNPLVPQDTVCGPFPDGPCEARVPATV